MKPSCLMLASLTALALIGVCHTATAKEFKVGNFQLRPYVGFEYNYMRLNAERYTVDINPISAPDFSGDLMDDHYSGFVPNIGLRGNHFGLEVGYLFSTEEDVPLVGLDSLVGSTGTSSTRIRGFNIDGNAYLTLAERLEAVGSVGVAIYKARTEVSGTIVTNGFTLPDGSTSADDTDAGLRLGLGLQFHLTDNVSLRGMVRYTGVEFENGGTTLGENLWSGALGLSYMF